ncbi:hypothetical protein JK358_32730 [Nocardia sp. 2]|uniref:Uncharacterized protein n=1 Tax=Nocardia acididurans TaxID=2802282 RepID=A0ABS1MF50_9NOCA|nr:hypothetical protein [Nocardia acididurans]MBL1079181.1 hypothetical protein [Nocardia acididurans]
MFLNACAETVFDSLHWSSSISSSKSNALIGLAVGCAFPTVTVLLVMLPVLRGWFALPGPHQHGDQGFLPQGHNPPAPRDPLVAVVFSGVAAALGVVLAVILAADHFNNAGAFDATDLVRQALWAAQVILLIARVIGLYLRHRAGRVMIVSGASLALIGALITEVMQWAARSTYSTIPQFGAQLPLRGGVHVQSGPRHRRTRSNPRSSRLAFRPVRDAFSTNVVSLVRRRWPRGAAYSVTRTGRRDRR